MEVKLASNHGFCFGVKRAVDCVLKLKGDVNTLGPLIHNPQFVKELEEKGIKVEADEKVKDAATANGLDPMQIFEAMTEIVSNKSAP